MIEARGLRKAFGESPVLAGVDLHVPRGRMLALLGPNGAGKTTLVRILSTLLAPDSGTASVAGYDLTSQAGGVRTAIGLTGQHTAVDGLLTGRENLVLMGRLLRLPRAAAGERGDALLEEFDLADAGNRPVKTYSGGMRRRLDLAASLITAPAVLFLDEPTTGLDPRSRVAVWQRVRDLLGAGTTILLTTQYLDEADQLADEVAVIDRGGILAQGTPAQLKKRVGAERLQLTFADADTAERARVAVGAQSLASGDTIDLAVRDTADIKRTLDMLDKVGIAPGRLRVAEPSLDDVFLGLTGQEETTGTMAGAR